jgi:hypothetical protein
MVADPFMTKNTIVGARSSDLHYGTALEADRNQFQIVNMAETTADRKYRIRCDFTADVKHTNGGDITLFDPAL